MKLNFNFKCFSMANAHFQTRQGLMRIFRLFKGSLDIRAKADILEYLHVYRENTLFNAPFKSTNAPLLPPPSPRGTLRPRLGNTALNLCSYSRRTVSQLCHSHSRNLCHTEMKILLPPRENRYATHLLYEYVKLLIVD